MNLLSLATGGDPVGFVKKYINKIFVHEQQKYNSGNGDISIILRKDPATGNIDILTYSTRNRTVLRKIPDKEVQDILTK